MSVIYRVAIGWGVTLTDDHIITPQPRNGEAKPIRRYGDGGPVDVGYFASPVWDVFETDEEFQTIMAQFGVLDAETCKVTFGTRNGVLQPAAYNCIAVQPQVGRNGSRHDFFLRDYTIPLHSLVAVGE